MMAHNGSGDEPRRNVTRNAMSGHATNVVQVGSGQEINFSVPDFSVPDDAPAPVTMPVAECSPLDLEVHRSIQVDGQAELPAYISRPHDERLRELVDLAAEGRSGSRSLSPVRRPGRPGHAGRRSSGCRPSGGCGTPSRPAGNISGMTRAVALLTGTDGQDAASRLKSFGLAPGGIVEGAWPDDL